VFSSRKTSRKVLAVEVPFGGSKRENNLGAPKWAIHVKTLLNDLFELISPTHKRTEGRAPVWGSEFTSKRRRTTGGDPAETAVG
jgi:hypothetical protein